MSVNKLELEAVVSKCAPFLMQKSFAPILTHFCFGDDKVVAYNDLQAIEIKYKSNLNCALPGSLLIKMLNSIQQHSLDIIQKTGEVQFKNGRSVVKLPSLPKEDFIFQMPDTSNCETVKLPLDVISGLANCLVSTSHDLASPEKNGVRLIIANKRLEFYSTDSISLSRYRYESVNVPDCSIDIIIPSTFCEQLIRLTKTKSNEIEETAFVNLLISKDSGDSFLIAEIDSNITVFTRLIEVEEKLPFVELVSEYESFIQSWFEVPDALSNIIERACILIPPEDKFVTVFESKGNTIMIDTTTKSGISDDVIEFESKVPEGRFRLNPEVIKRVLYTMSHLSFCFDNSVLALSGCNGNFLHFVSAKQVDE